MKIQPFKSNEHLRANDPCTEGPIFFIFAYLNPSLFTKFETELQVP